jgi:mono/diheme cytochrome c family protein
MQVKVIIGTIAFMLVMIIFGFATLIEPARLDTVTSARAGRQIEDGAHLYQNNCATCHGIAGKAEQCFDASGNQIGCQGLPLQSIPLLCGEPTERMVQLGWSGSKQSLIQQTVAAGRIGTSMPTWSRQFGGPMEDHQIEEVTAFIMNWSLDTELCGEDVFVERVEWPESAEDLPEGDAGNGPGLYEITYGCQSCHGDPGVADSNLVGPWLGNIANVAAERVEGQSAAQYIYESILYPNAFVAPICARDLPCADPSTMPDYFGDRMSLQDMADIVSYYLTLSAD